MKGFGKTASAALIAILFFIASSACAAPAIKIGVIDTQKIMLESKAAKEARQVFLMDVEAKRSVLKSKEKEVRNLDQEIKEDGPKMNAATLKSKRDKLSDEMKELKRLRTDISDDLKKKDAELTQKVLKEIDVIVKDYSKKEKFTVIFDRRVVIDFDDKIEITGDIIKIYDGKKK